MDFGALDLIDANNQKCRALALARESSERDRKRFTLGAGRQQLDSSRAWVCRRPPMLKLKCRSHGRLRSGSMSAFRSCTDPKRLKHATVVDVDVGMLSPSHEVVETVIPLAPAAI